MLPSTIVPQNRIPFNAARYWSFPKNLSEQEAELVIWSPLVGFLSSYSLSRPAENCFNAVSQSVIPKIRYSKDALCCIEGMKSQNLELGLVSDLNSGEKGGCQDQGCHVFESLGVFRRQADAYLPVGE
jgi:hypothetical protein